MRPQDFVRGQVASPSWYDSLHRNGNGPFKGSLANALTALQEAPEWKGILAYDEFSMRIVCLKPPPFLEGTRAGSIWSDTHDVWTTNWLAEHGLTVSTRTTAEAVGAVARENPFHPVRDYLDALAWDGVGRLEHSLLSQLGVESTDYSRAVIARWCISAVARIFEPGCKADSVLILEGAQGIGKSTALRILGGSWFSDEVSDFGSKDAAMQIRNAWIIELGELVGLSRAEITRIKAFLARSVDSFRPPYGRHVIDSPRQSVFAGTANDFQYLKDETGARRFWPVLCSRAIQLEALRADRDQIWAEACHRYRSREPWWLDSPLLIQAAETEQSDRYNADPWIEKIEPYLSNHLVVTNAAVLESCLDIQPSHWTQTDQNRVARCLQTLGWARAKERQGKTFRWVYVKKE